MIEITVINTLFLNYRDWFLSNECGDSRTNYNQLKESLDKIKAAIESVIVLCDGENAMLLWEAVVDHWHQVEWCYDDAPDVFADLYDAVDTFRVNNPLTLSS
jgi:hypothetical protein